MNIFKLLSITLSAIAVLCMATPAWALYKQRDVVTAMDWLVGLALIVLTLYIFIRARFCSSKRLWVSLGLAVFNLSVWGGAYLYLIYIDMKFKGYDAIPYLAIPGTIHYYLETFSIPISVFIIALLSKKPKRMIAAFFAILITFCALELGTNYLEINRYLSDAERSGYQKFKYSTNIRNYISASDITALRLYPRLRTRKVLLAELKAKSWVDRDEGAYSLKCLKDLSTIPALLECMRIEDKTVTPDYARIQCAITLEMLLSNNYDYSVYDAIQNEYKKDPAKLFDRIEKKAVKYMAGKAGK